MTGACLPPQRESGPHGLGGGKGIEQCLMKTRTGSGKRLSLCSERNCMETLAGDAYGGRSGAQRKRFPLRRESGRMRGADGKRASAHDPAEPASISILDRLAPQRNGQTAPERATVSSEKRLSERASRRVSGMFLFQGAWPCLLRRYPGDALFLSQRRRGERNRGKGQR